MNRLKFLLNKFRVINVVDIRFLLLRELKDFVVKSFIWFLYILIFICDLVWILNFGIWKLL